MEMSRVSLTAGSITFWTKPRIINFASTTQNIFFQYKFINGELYLRKNAKDFLIFTHKYKGKITRVKKSISKLTKTKKHFFAVTWDMNKRIIKLYVDGKLVDKSVMKL